MGSFLDFIDNTLGTHFNTPKYDPTAGRKKLARVIDTAARQHSEGSTTAPNRSWKAGHNDAISFAPKIDGKPVLIAGEAVNYVPADRFPEFLSGLKAAVEAGDLDAEIKAALEGDKPAKAGTKPRTVRASTGLGSRAQPDNAEWMAKFVERYGEAPGEGYVPNSKGTKWVSAANAARGQNAAKSRFG